MSLLISLSPNAWRRPRTVTVLVSPGPGLDSMVTPLPLSVGWVVAGVDSQAHLDKVAKLKDFSLSSEVTWAVPVLGADC